MSAREEAIAGIAAKTGKTREQTEAFLEILGSAFRRRGWSEGDPLSQDEIGAKLNTFLGANCVRPDWCVCEPFNPEHSRLCRWRSIVSPSDEDEK